MKSMEEERRSVEAEICQLKNRQKILLNKKSDAERKERTHRLIERGAILESVFPFVIPLSNIEVKAFLSEVSQMPEVRKLLKMEQKTEGALIHRSGVVRPAGSVASYRARWGAALPKPLARLTESHILCGACGFS